MTNTGGEAGVLPQAMDLAWLLSPTLPLRELIPLAAAVGGSLVGAWWGARLRMKQYQRVQLNELSRWRATQRDQKISFLRSIRAEMNILWRRYDELLGRAVETLTLEDVGRINHAFTQDYFTVYHSSAAMLGLIEDSEVALVVIDTYLQAKAVIDIVHVISAENREITRLEDDRNAARSDAAAGAYLTRRIATLLNNAQARYDKITRDHAKFRQLVARLNLVLEAEIARLATGAAS